MKSLLLARASWNVWASLLTLIAVSGTPAWSVKRTPSPHRSPERSVSKKVGRFVPLQLENKIVFIRNDAAWTMNPDGSEQKRVWQPRNGYGVFGGFSPDGTQALSYNAFNLYLHNLKTKRFRRFFLHSEGWGTYIDSVAWSRDGKQILFVAGANVGAHRSAHVYLVKSQQPFLTELAAQKFVVKNQKADKGDLHEPRLSLDRTRIVASLSDRNDGGLTGSWNIWTVELNSSNAQQVTDNISPFEWQSHPEQLAALDKRPCFAPDCRRIAFVRNVNHWPQLQSDDIWMVDAQGGNERCLTNYEAVAAKTAVKSFEDVKYNTVENLFFNRDGDRIAFNQFDNLLSPIRIPKIYIIDVNTKVLRLLTDGELVQWVW